MGVTAHWILKSPCFSSEQNKDWEDFVSSPESKAIWIRKIASEDRKQGLIKKMIGHGMRISPFIYAYLWFGHPLRQTKVCRKQRAILLLMSMRNQTWRLYFLRTKHNLASTTITRIWALGHASKHANIRRVSTVRTFNQIKLEILLRNGTHIR